MSTVHLEAELERLLTNRNVYENLSVARLIEKALDRKEGILTSTGAFCSTTGKYTGRSPKDKFIVRERSVEDKIDWGPVNQPISAEVFEKLYTKVLYYLSEKEDVYVRNGIAGADE